MGVQIHEALRHLCVEFGWSYAVLWKAIRCVNQMQFVWEDGYWEPMSGSPSISGFKAMDLRLKERGVTRSYHSDLLSELELECQSEDRVCDRVCSLFYTTMATQVHVVGEGIVGQAALTGIHQWILQDAHHDLQYVPKALTEINQQFLAGIQTIATIPMLPYGVVQLGSTQMVVENFEFVNHVRRLFTEIGCVPAVLASDITTKSLSQNIHAHALLGKPMSINPSRDASINIKLISPQSNGGCNHQFPKAPDSDSVLQPLLFAQLHGNIATTVSQGPSTMNTLSATANPLNDISQPTPTVHPILKPVHQHDQLETGTSGAQKVFSSPNIWSVRNMKQHNSSYGGHHQSRISTTGLCSSVLPLLDEQLLSISGSFESARKYKINSNNSKAIVGSEELTSSSSKNSEPFDPRKLPNGMDDDLETCSLFPFDNTGRFKIMCPISSVTEVHEMLDSTDQSKGSQMLSEDFRLRCLTYYQTSQRIPTEEQQSNDNDLFHAHHVASAGVNEQRSSDVSLHSNPQNCLLSIVDPMHENIKNKGIVCAENGTRTTPSRQHIKRTFSSPEQPTSANDLFDLFGLDSKYGAFGSNHDSVFVHCSNGNAHTLRSDASTCLTQLDTRNAYGAEDDDRGLYLEPTTEQLLDAVVAQINSGAKQNNDDGLSCNTSLTRICNSSPHTDSPMYRWLTSSEQIHTESLGHSPVLVKSETEGSSSVISARSVDKTGGCSQKDGTYNSQISLLVDNGQRIVSDNISAMHCRKIDELGKLNKKRARPGENPRPRPKDRQMIQDRIKELREIIPNGAKLSIDTLLEKTIKHMLFLQSVKKHADKLKEVGDPKVICEEGGLLSEEKFEGGATWAFEVDTQSMICPIIVEDLKSPRQMLVEMLCEERGLFLEIADLIRGLGLTILKGMMEARDGKIRARFVVEANRDVTRMEIFLSLVHLLELNGGSSLAWKGVENLSMPRNIFQQPSSIPATGLADRLS